MTQTKKFAWSSIAVILAMFAAFAMLTSTAFADVDAVTADPNVIAAGDPSDVTAEISAPADGDTVTFRIQASSDAEGEWEINGEQIIDCVLDVVAGAITGVECDGETVLTFDGVLNTITLEVESDSNSPEGDLDILVSHDGIGATTTIFVVSGVGDVETIEILGAPASIAEGGEEDIRIVAFNDAGARIIQDLTVVIDGDGELITDGAGNCERLADEGGTDTECDITTSTSATSANQAGVGVRADGDAGDTMTVTAYGFGPSGAPVFATAEIVIADDEVASLAITAPPTVTAGSSSEVTITAEDEDGNPVPDETVIEVDATAGVLVCEDGGETDDGVATCTFVAPGSAQTVVLTAIGDGEVATASVVVTGTGPGPGPGPGTGEFEGTIAPSGASLVTYTGGTLAELAADAAAEGAISVWVTVGGDFVGHIVGAPAFVNAAFTAHFADGNVPADTIVILVK